jgi:hypothetical protein
MIRYLNRLLAEIREAYLDGALTLDEASATLASEAGISLASAREILLAEKY